MEEKLDSVAFPGAVLLEEHLERPSTAPTSASSEARSST